MSICYGIGIRGGLCDDGFLYHHSVHSGSGTCQGPFFYVFLCQGLHGSYGTCDTSLYLFFKEGNHSPCLSSIPLAGYISCTGELEII